MLDFKKKYLLLLIVVLIVMIIFTGCNGHKNSHENQLEKENNIDEKTKQTKISERLKDRKEKIIDKYKNQIPKEWGENVSGVITRIDTNKKVVALTLDACGSSRDGYDSKLIDFLKQKKIPATLFINFRWIINNKEIFMELSRNSLFTIANHGTHHLPLSVSGKSAYDIKGTTSVEEVVNEVAKNELKIQNLTEKKPEYFRSGTAYYDEIAVEIVNDLGEKVIGYDTLGDAGATFIKKQVKNAFLSVSSGSIILAHMNHPESDTAEGVIEAVPELRSRGFQFVKLKDYDNQLISKVKEGR
ncbi:polysaccharide deacetylase family protein [Sporohalobacter salinus]|uniref:polysaccharide deacetylase family protein n=1 Tax=Sporohalobacter salinus TaxID=1494606 RepID=UPI001960A144|nr:polysaccharide deacetylase family protein [Sporohalobacter salinus]MBM7622484.1 peptidoglycan/xylan/chitin deacetylase (PgdA/CDA1 family) [Sporohalobacter salinus]